MDFLEIFKAIILGIVQGITEWLPVSSTGHMILVDEFIKLNFSSTFVSTFLVVVQFGSILAVLILYFNKLNPFSEPQDTTPKNDRVSKCVNFIIKVAAKLHIKLKLDSEKVSLWLKVIVAVTPSAIIGVLFDDKIEEVFFNPTVVSITLIIYGILFIFIENRNKKSTINSFSELTYKTAIFIGMFQVLALIPGTSRSGATIIGAVLLGTSRFIAAEFSFFLAVPTMLGASALKLFDAGFAFSSFEWIVLLTGSVVAFLVSIFAIKFLMDYIKKHDFKVFGYYRIVLGILVLLYFFVIK